MPLQVAQISVGVTANTQQATAQLNSFKGALTGVGGSVQSFTQYMMLSGQAMGPWQSGLYMASQGLRQMATAASFAQGSIMALTAAMGAVAALAVRFGAPIQQGMQQLQVALDNNGLKWDDMASSIDKAVTTGEHFGRQAGESYQALAILITTTHSAEAATHNLALVQDLAARTGMTLAAAANIVARAYEGYGRSLQQYTDGFKFVRPSIDAAAKSQDALDKATATYDSHLQTLNNHLANQAERAGAASLKVDQLARAQQGLADTYQQIADAQARQAIDDMVPRISAQQGATESLAAAQARLARDTAEIANRPPYQSNLTDATDKLTIAQIRLQEAQQKQVTSAQTSHADYRKLVDLQTNLAEAQQRLQTAQGADIGDAQANLSNAIARQRTELDQMHDTVRNTLADRASLIQAEMNVRDAILAVNAARAADTAQATGTAPGQVSDRQRLIDDATAVANAQRDLDRAVLVDQQDAARKALETTITQRDAARSVADAEQRITDAVNQQSAAGISGGSAQRTIDQERVALAKEHDALMQKILNNIMAQAELDAQNKHNQEGLDKAAANLRGSADAAGKGWSGMLKRISAEIADWLGAHVPQLQAGFLGLLAVDALFPKLLPGLMSGLGSMFGTMITGVRQLAMTVGPTIVEALSPLAAPVALAAAAVAASLLIDAGFKRLPKVAQDLVGPLELPFKSIATFAKDSGTVLMDVVHGDWGKALSDLGPLFEHQLTMGWHAIEGFFTRIGSLLGEFVPKIAAAVAGGIATAWHFVIEELQKLPGLILGAILNAGKWLLNTGVDIIAGLANGLINGYVKVAQFFVQLPFTVAGYFINAVEWLLVEGGKVVEGLVQGLVDALPTVIGWFTALPGKLVATFVDAASWLVEMGKHVLSGLLDGVKWFFDGGFSSWFGGMKDRVVGLLVNVGNWLTSVGTTMIDGMVNGLEAGWSAMATWFVNLPGNVWQQVKDIGGWLFDAGKWLVKGMIDGLEWAWNKFADIATITLPKIHIIGTDIDIGGGKFSFLPHINWQIPGFAEGVYNWQGGLALVGERGPELVNLPRGSDVFRSGTGPSGNTVIHIHVAGSVQTEADLVGSIRNGLIDAGRRNGGNYLAGVA